MEKGPGPGRDVATAAMLDQQQIIFTCPEIRTLYESWTRREQQEREDGGTGRFLGKQLHLTVYIPGLFIGMVGLFSSVRKTIGTNRKVKIASELFGGVVGFGTFLVMVYLLLFVSFLNAHFRFPIPISL